MDPEPDLLAEFTVESLEHLEAVEPLLLAMEQSGGAQLEDYNRIFRALHSIKGAAGFLGQAPILTLSHVAESLLMGLRDGELEFDEGMVDPLLRVVDVLRSMFQALPGSIEFPDDLHAELEALLTEPRDAPAALDTRDATPDTAADEEGETGLLIGEICVELGLMTSEECARVLELQYGTDPPQSFGIVARELGLLDEGEVSEALAEQMIRLARFSTPDRAESPASSSPPTAKPSFTEASAQSPQRRTNERGETIRVRLPLLDKLMDLAGELVLSRNQLRKRLDLRAPDGLKTILQRVDQITSELQEGIMNTRMQPVGNLFDRLPRTVRDTAQKLGKEVELELDGGDVELDRSLLESLVDPLIHLIRNALDHGLEAPHERVAAGKTPCGKLLVRARHGGGHVVVEVTDDGRGIDPERVLARAIECGALAPDAASSLTETEALALVFHPGLSTAGQVTDVSGRGVGMDVVRCNIEALGGQVEITSEIGRGSRVRIRVPLTLAILPSLLVGCAGQRFAIGQAHLAEVVRVEEDDRGTRLQPIQGVQTLRLRDRLLPLIHLDRVLGIEVAAGRTKGPLNVVVLHASAGDYGLVVDEFLDGEEIVVKPLSPFVADCRWFAGAAILGDGAVAMILDVEGLAARARLDLHVGESVSQVHAPESDQVARSLIVFDAAPGERFCFPLGELQRLERIGPDAIERVGSREFVQHRGRAIPLVRLDRVLPVGPLSGDHDELYVLIPRRSDGTVGILASRIVDTLVSTLQPTASDGEPRVDGLLGRMVLDGHLTHCLEAEGLLRAAGIEVQS